MDRGLYIAASGMLAEQARQDQIANDLANASTPGYKADNSSQEEFGQLLLENTATGQTIGALGLGARIARTTVDMTPAPLNQTGEPLDLGLDGQGFFAVQTAAGRRYTRDGQLDVDGSGRLETTTGYPLLDTQNQPIKVGSAAGLAISSDGVVSQGGKTIATIGVVSLTNPVKQGDTLFAGTPGARPTGTAVRQGYLESSGVNATSAMVEMMTSLRTFQSDQQAVQAIDQTLGEGIQAGGL
jgi:flagellar basal-body rod protein FlgG